MAFDDARKLMTARLVDSLYTEAMILADEARGYFDEVGRTDRDGLRPFERVAFSCESLKVTTRLMHIIAWLLTRKALAAGEIDAATVDAQRLGDAAGSNEDAVFSLPRRAGDIVAASIDLYQRVGRIARDMIEPETESPALGLIRRLERAL